MPRPKKIIIEPEQPKRWTSDGVPGSVENRNGRAADRIGLQHVVGRMSRRRQGEAERYTLGGRRVSDVPL